MDIDLYDLEEIKFLEYCSNCNKAENCNDFCQRFLEHFFGKDYRSIKQSLGADCRNNNLDPKSSVGIGYITEVLVARFLGIKTCFEITDNFSYRRYDMLEHEDFGKINTKGSRLSNRRVGKYLYSSWRFGINKNIYPDFYFCIGYSRRMKNVNIVYIIPNDIQISNIDMLYINPKWTPEKDPYHWFMQDPRPWNNLFHSLKLHNCPVLRKRDD